MSDLVGSHHFDRFLERYVFADLPDDIQRFLLDTCVLDPVLADQCPELTGRNDADQILRWLERRHVFTNWIGGQPRAFRYHPLLRSWLLGRLSGMRVCELAQRAGTWSRQNGRSAEAIEYLLDARDVDGAVEAIVEYGLQALAEGRYEALVACRQALPGSALRTRRRRLARRPGSLYEASRCIRRQR